MVKGNVSSRSSYYYNPRYIHYNLYLSNGTYKRVALWCKVAQQAHDLLDQCSIPGCAQ